jgi:hypothetical protein
VMDAWRELVLEVYDRIIGLEVADVAVDGCITKARDAATRRRAEARWIEENKAPNAPQQWTERVSS